MSNRLSISIERVELNIDPGLDVFRASVRYGIVEKRYAAVSLNDMLHFVNGLRMASEMLGVKFEESKMPYPVTKIG